MVGSLLRVRYELTSLLGEGPVFSQYAAKDKVMNQDVCVRIANRSFASEPEFRTKLETVVSEWQSLHHGNLQGYQSVDSDESNLFVVSSPNKGTNLIERLNKLAPFSAPVAVSTAIGIAEGLAAIHQSGKVHGDVGAHNVAVTPEGDVQVQGMGLWSTYSAATGAGMAMLPLMAPYLAPEVSEGGMPTQASDVYGLGIILFELLTGRQPYLGDSALATAMRHSSQPTPSVREVNSAVPVVLDEIVKRAMAKNPIERYQTASEMLSDLRILQDALRFGRTLTWPLRPDAKQSPSSVAPKMSAIREQEPERKRPRGGDEYDGDVPVWAKMLVAFLAGLLALMVLGWIVFNLQKPKLVTVPSLERLTLVEAQQRLKELGLELKVSSTVASESIPTDQIIESSPPANQKAYEGSEVNVKVSAGSKFVEVPDVRGLTLDKAKLMLGSVRLEADDEVKEVSSRDVEEGMVIGTEPEWGSRVERGTRVRLTVSVGRKRPNDESRDVGEKLLYTLKITVSGVTSAVILRVDISDDLGTRTIHESTQEPDAELELPAEGFGKKVTFQIYYDGELVKTVTQGNADGRRIE
ncbi:MAG TPA: PASTA domain-containing protein [Fimbriimonadaceae bacterium]|nr:PASTA domain-containing protein [Fimbriimonadaceae bacterium]